jgi:deazaflavin-dependent oxidoreductase (nitroreductase family)
VLISAAASLYRRLLFWLGRQPWFNSLGPRVFAPVDAWLYPRMHGSIVSAGPPVLPLLLLTTRGRRSGRPRSVPLLYTQLDARLIVVASNWGRRQHPAWSENLLADPRCVVQIGCRTYDVRARLLPAHAKAAVWPRLRSFCPVWEVYAEQSGRDLRVFVLGSAVGA